jgi:hypothetical protein
MLPQGHICSVSRDHRPSHTHYRWFLSQPPIDAPRNAGVYFLLMFRSNGFAPSIFAKGLAYACASRGVLVEFE